MSNFIKCVDCGVKYFWNKKHICEIERKPVMTKLTDFFKPEDFDNGIGCYKAAEIANAKLQELVESWSMVYTRIILDGPMTGSCEQLKMPHHTHQARLAFITELPKEPCKHQPVKKLLYEIGDMQIYYECAHCGVELTATWEEKK